MKIATIIPVIIAKEPSANIKLPLMGPNPQCTILNNTPKIKKAIPTRIKTKGIMNDFKFIRKGC